MTWLWTALIVIGIAMIVAAVWPSIRGRGKAKDEDNGWQTPEGE
jgi:hypothetical protein